MSFLSWAFVFGGLAIAFPILFHLIRRAPRGRVPFGSLMFLRPSPPRITRRSRIDNWLLLLLRALAVLLVAAAFTRPYFRTAGGLFFADPPGGQVAILLDTSASMRREGLWQQALDRARHELADVHPSDQLALFAFSEGLREVVGFEPDLSLPASAQQAAIEHELDSLEPDWGPTRLGEALMSLSRILAESGEGPAGEQFLSRRIVLISDLQTGSELAELQGEDWPADVRVEIATVRADRPGNASLRLASEREISAAQPDGPRVRVVNQADSPVDQFQVGWAGENGEVDASTVVDFYVPAGSSLVQPVPRGGNPSSGELVLTGDDCPFDNRYFVADIEQRELVIEWLGSGESADDRESALYFLKRVFPETAARRVSVQPRDSALDYNNPAVTAPQLIVVARPLAAEEAAAVEAVVRRGAVALVVLHDESMFGSVQSLTGNLQPGAPPGDDDYAMLVNIDFSHPLFAPLAGPRYNDFSKIRFWKTIPVRVPEDRALATLARFDNGNAALVERTLEQGAVLVLATSWEPAASQLALSTRFLPLMWGLLRLSGTGERAIVRYDVGELLQIPAGQAWQLERPDGSLVEVSGDDRNSRPRLEQPGRYLLRNDGQTITIVANLDAEESVTEPLQADHLESLGVVTGSRTDRQRLALDLKKASESRLEASQRLWKWLLVGALVLLIVETGLAGRKVQG